MWALYEAVPEGVRPAILLGAHAGLRLAEAAALRVEDVDFATGVVSPSIQWLDEPLKSDASRTSIPIPKEMVHLLAEAIQLGDGRFLASDQWGNPGGPWTIERAIRACREPAGLPDDFRFHDLRHTWASWHRQAGTSCDELKELGGWKSREMVDRYAKYATEHLAVAATRIERVRAETVGNIVTFSSRSPKKKDLPLRTGP